jgi:hypothetical protein
MLHSRETINTNSIVFDLTRSGLKPTIYSTGEEHANHYTTTIYSTGEEHANHYTTTIYSTGEEHANHYTTNVITQKTAVHRINMHCEGKLKLMSHKTNGH